VSALVGLARLRPSSISSFLHVCSLPGIHVRWKVGWFYLNFYLNFTYSNSSLYFNACRKKKVASENYERLNTPQNNEYQAQQVRPSSGK
jgi:hypothetical protein